MTDGSRTATLDSGMLSLSADRSSRDPPSRERRPQAFGEGLHLFPSDLAFETGPFGRWIAGGGMGRDRRIDEQSALDRTSSGRKSLPGEVLSGIRT